MSTPIVPIIMGSKSDLDHGQKIARTLEKYGIESEIRVASAHKAAAYCLSVLEHYESMDRPKVYVTIAGRSNALSGLVDAHISAPSIACPPSSNSFAGADILVAAYAVGRGTGWLRCRQYGTLGPQDLGPAVPSLKATVIQAQTDFRNGVINADKELNS